MTDEHIFEIKKAIMECKIVYPTEEKAAKKRKIGGVRKFIPYIIYFLLLLSFGLLLAFSDEDVRQRILTSLFVQHLLSH